MSNPLDRLPHGEGLRLLDSVLSYNERSLEARGVVKSSLLPLHGSEVVSSALAVEYIGQAIAVHMALTCEEAGSHGEAGAKTAQAARKRAGYIVRLKRFRFSSPFFAPGEELLVSVTCEGGTAESAMYSGSVVRAETNEVLAEGELLVHVPDEGFGERGS